MSINQRLGDILTTQELSTQSEINKGLKKKKSDEKLHVYNRLGETLVNMGICEPGNIMKALRKQKIELMENTSIGRVLLDMGIITEEQLIEALETPKSTSVPLGEVLVEKGFCSNEELDTALKRQAELRVHYFRLPEESGFEPVNIIKILVNEWIDDLINEKGGCPCDQCRADVMALTLNKLPPRYVNNIRSLIDQIDSYRDEYKFLVREKILESIEHVNQNPKLSCRRRAEKIRGDVRGTVPVNVSNRHVHLSEEHLYRLFGRDYELTRWKDLMQPGEFAAEETVILKGPKGKIEKVRVLGPPRAKTQVEISGTDQFILGIKAPVRESGKLDGTPGIDIEGRAGSIIIREGVIRALRHIHMTPADGTRFGVKNGDYVKVRLKGDRTTVLEGVLIRIKDRAALEMHIDTDEANAAGVPQSSEGEVLI